jgi:hypothetical protein
LAHPPIERPAIVELDDQRILVDRRGAVDDQPVHGVRSDVRRDDPFGARELEPPTGGTADEGHHHEGAAEGPIGIPGTGALPPMISWPSMMRELSRQPLTGSTRMDARSPCRRDS